MRDEKRLDLATLLLEEQRGTPGVAAPAKREGDSPQRDYALATAQAKFGVYKTPFYENGRHAV